MISFVSALLAWCRWDSTRARGCHARVAAQKRAIIAEGLDRNGGNVAAAARDLELQVTYLHRLIRTSACGNRVPTGR